MFLVLALRTVQAKHRIVRSVVCSVVLVASSRNGRFTTTKFFSSFFQLRIINANFLRHSLTSVSYLMSSRCFLMPLRVPLWSNLSLYKIEMKSFSNLLLPYKLSDVIDSALERTWFCQLVSRHVKRASSIIWTLIWANRKPIRKKLSFYRKIVIAYHNGNNNWITKPKR